MLDRKMMPSGPAQKEERVNCWITSAEGISFFIHQVMSTVGAILAGVLVVLCISLFSALLTRNTSGGNFIDHVVEQRPFALFNQPYYVAPVACAIIFGVLSYYLSRSRGGAPWVWLLPLAFLVWNVLTWKGAGPPTTSVYWADVWTNYFGTDCGGSECLYELFVTVPFYTSVAYSLGWVVSSLVRRHR